MRRLLMSLVPITIALAAVIGSCLVSYAFHHQHQDPHAGMIKLQSWDQENLKRDDHGCPTAIYVAPHGELRQCQ